MSRRRNLGELIGYVWVVAVAACAPPTSSRSAQPPNAAGEVANAGGDSQAGEQDSDKQAQSGAGRPGVDERSGVGEQRAEHAQPGISPVAHDQSGAVEQKSHESGQSGVTVAGSNVEPAPRDTTNHTKHPVPTPTRKSVTAALRSLDPKLQLHCTRKPSCIQTGDLDGDQQPDTVAVVIRNSALGVVLFTSRAGTLQVGAGKAVLLPADDWELDEQNQRIWTSDGHQQLLADWRGLAIWVSPAHRQTACARGMQLGHDALVYSGTDAAEAVIVREGTFRWVPCGY